MMNSAEFQNLKTLQDLSFFFRPKYNEIFIEILHNYRSQDYLHLEFLFRILETHKCHIARATLGFHTLI